MVKFCVFCGAEGTESRTYHRFPLKENDILLSWLQNMGLGSSFVPKKHSLLCSDHFEEKLFEQGTNIRCLRKGSIPTLFGEYKSACVYCHVRKGEDETRSFRKFPLDKPQLLQKWLMAMKLKDFIPNKRSWLCSDHFEKKCFRSSGRGSVLRANAVPSLFSSEESGGIPVRVQCNSPDQVDDGDGKESMTQQRGTKRKSSECSAPPSKVTISHRPATTTSMQSEKQIAMDISAVELCNGNIEPTTNAAEKVNTPIRCRTPETPSDIKKRISLAKHDHHYELSPRSMRKKFIRQQNAMKILKKRMHVQKQHISRLKKKVSSLKDIVSELRRTRAIPDSGLECLDSIAGTDVSQFLKRFIKNQNNLSKENEKENNKPKKRQWKCQRKNNGKGISRDKYPAALRSFAMTLHFYSPKAYGFVRRKFCKALPDPSTLRSWYSAIDGAPGFTSESFEALKQKVALSKKSDKQVIVGFTLDEISIKKSLQRLPNGQISGHVDFGSNIESDDTLPLAKDALVMMVVGLDQSWKIPIGYFLINGIDSATNSGLITEALIRLHEIEVQVISLTLDGPAEHFATMRALGASFDLSNCKPFFPHPSTQQNVHVIFDACHMLKLVRNTLGDLKVLKDDKGSLVEWRYIEALANLQEKEGLRAGNKLKMAHIRYWKMKMKVALAAQTLSDSVADSIEFCNKYLNLKEFEGSEATVNFIRCINRLFDFLNSRNPLAKGFKAPLRTSNEQFWRPSILSHIEYLESVTDISGTPMIHTRRYVAFVGFITAIKSIIQIFENYVKPENSQMKYLLTYKFSQDHLELFFCAVRSCGGWCPNPTSRQFMSAYKRLLVHHQVQAVNGNAEAMDSTSILSVSCTRKKKVDYYDQNVYDAIANIRVMKKYDLGNDSQENEADNFFTEFDNFIINDPQLSNFSRACVGYIAGWVVRKLVNKKKCIVRCEICQGALLQDSQNLAQFEQNCLIEAKTNGGLLFPSESVIRICETTENLLRHCLDKFNGMVPVEQNFSAVLCSKVLLELLQSPCTLFPQLNEHMFDDAANDVNHIYLLSKQVCKAYLDLRLYAATKIACESAVGIKVRHHLTRRIIWERQ